MPVRVVIFTLSQLQKKKNLGVQVFIELNFVKLLFKKFDLLGEISKLIGSLILS